MNGELGPSRSFDWLTMPLDDVKQLRHELGCSINDIVLGTVAGAVRRYLFRRRVSTEGLDFRVSAPVSVRREEHKGKLGNHVSSWIVPMPLDEAEPLERVAQIRAATEEMKTTGAAAGIETLMAAAEWMTPGLLARGAGMAKGPINMIVTNVPGPQFPLYSVGARMHGMYPMVPLLEGTGLGVALFSYEGRLCWGFNADSGLVPDLDVFVADVAAAFEEIRSAVVSDYMARRTAAPEEAPKEPATVSAPKPARRRRKTATARKAAGA
jgi:WS/DGAT/MGAT family acyltransferase